MPIVFNNSKTKKERPFGRFFLFFCSVFIMSVMYVWIKFLLCVMKKTVEKNCKIS